MQHIQKGSKGISRHVSNLGFVHQCLVEEVCGVLLLSLFLIVLLVPVLGLLLLYRCAGDVEPHFDQLVGARSGLSSAVLSASRRLTTRAIGFGRRERKLHCHFIFSCQVGVRDLRIGDFKGRSVLDIERKLGFGELRLAPVPAAQGVFAILDVDSVPDFKGLGQSFKVLAAQRVSQGRLQRCDATQTSWSKPSS